MWYNATMKLKNKWLGFLTVILLVGLDMTSKHLIVSQFQFQEMREVIANFFWLTYVKNTGAAWSILSNSTQFLGAVSVVAALAMIYFYLKKQWSLLSRISLCLMMAGTIGNGIDRLVYGYVVDMLSFNIFGYMFPVFNLADTFLVIGVALFALETFLKGESHV